MDAPETPPMPPPARTALTLGCLSIVAAPMVALALGYVGYKMVEGSGGVGGFFLPALGIFLGVPAVVTGFRALATFPEDHRVPGRGAALGGIALGILASVSAAALGVVGAFFAAAAGNLPGRPFRVRGRPRVADVTPGIHWNGPVSTVTVDGLTPARRAELARAWQAEAQGEHASIASFSRLAMELLAAGAPPSLLVEAHRAALDEVTHAQMCFAMANAYSEIPVTPTVWPEALAMGVGTTLTALAVGSLVDGCLHEGFAARAAEIGAGLTTDGAVRAVLTTLAVDEARHAALAWSIVGWCVATGGDTVREALARTVDDLPATTTRRCFVPGEEAPEAVAAAYGEFCTEVVAALRSTTTDRVPGSRASRG